MIHVVHCKKHKNHEYIGRPSPLGNPFAWDKSTPKGSTLPRYKAWLEEQIQRKNKDILEELNRLKAIAEAGNLYLGCWCSPSPCHGDIIKQVLESMALKHKEEITLIQFSKKAKDIITSPIPSELIKQKPGKAAADYISGSTVVDYLNHAFGYLWSYETIEQWVQPGVDKFNAKYDKEPAPQGPVAHVKGRLTVLLPQSTGETLTITKEQYGSKAIIGGQMDQEHIFKAAGTDAMKKCASLFGIGLELYRSAEEQEYFDIINYDDPWTEEMIAKFEAERNVLKGFMAQYDLDEEGMIPYLQAFSDNQFDHLGFIVPDNIASFAQYLTDVQDKS